MKKQLSMIAMTIALVTGSAHLKAADETAKATIPFAFQAGPVNLTAGVYEVSWRESTRTMMLRDSAGKAVLINGGSPDKDGQDVAKLVFHKVGSQYFLAEAWFPNQMYSHKLPPSKREREMVARDQKPQTVFLALR